MRYRPTRRRIVSPTTGLREAQRWCLEMRCAVLNYPRLFFLSNLSIGTNDRKIIKQSSQNFYSSYLECLLYSKK